MLLFISCTLSYDARVKKHKDVLRMRKRRMHADRPPVTNPGAAMVAAGSDAPVADPQTQLM
eukprot:356422-Chlamydomonas_euryale.AAC.3